MNWKSLDLFRLEQRGSGVECVCHPPVWEFVVEMVATVMLSSIIASNKLIRSAEGVLFLQYPVVSANWLGGLWKQAD